MNVIERKAWQLMSQPNQLKLRIHEQGPDDWLGRPGVQLPGPWRRNLWQLTWTMRSVGARGGGGGGGLCMNVMLKRAASLLLEGFCPKGVLELLKEKRESERERRNLQLRSDICPPGWCGFGLLAHHQQAFPLQSCRHATTIGVPVICRKPASHGASYRR